MNKKERIRTIWDESFANTSSQWRQWFFDNVYDDDEALLLIKDGNPMSTLMLQRRTQRYDDVDIPMAYIAGAATARRVRGHGHMSRLMDYALGESYARGDLVASLIPADRSLYNFYDRFGFATVVYVDVERYTSLHAFRHDGNFEELKPDADIFSALQENDACTVVHQSIQYEQVAHDINLDNGVIKSVRDNSTGDRAIAFATADSDRIIVKTLLADGGSQSNAAMAVLSLIREAFGDKPIEVWAHPRNDANRARMRSRAMMRVIDCHDLLQIIAAKHQRIEQVIKVSDPLIASNNGYFIMRDGMCRHCDTTFRHVTLDVDISTLTKIIFGSPALSSIIGMPACRPCLDLMLD